MSSKSKIWTKERERCHFFVSSDQKRFLKSDVGLNKDDLFIPSKFYVLINLLTIFCVKGGLVAFKEALDNILH